MSCRIRLCIIFLLFIIFWFLPGFIMHFSSSTEALLSTQDFVDVLLLRNTVVIALAALIVSIGLGLPVAYYLAYSDFAFRNFFTTMLLLPLCIPPYVGAIGWLHLTNYAIQGETLAGLLMAGTIFGLSYFPIITLFSVTGFLQIDKQLEESARLTHPDRTVFFKISIPLAKPFIMAGIILVFLFVVLDYGVADFFMIRTYSIELFTQFSLHNMRAAVTATYPLLLLAIGLALLESVLVRNSSYIPSSDALTSTYRKRSSFAPILVIMLVTISAGIPLISLMHMAGGVSNYVSVVRSSSSALGNTFLFGVLSAAAIVVFGFIWAHTIDALKRGKTLLKMVSNISLAIPGGLIGISLIMMWNHQVTSAIYHSAGIIILCNFARFSPVAFKAIMAPFMTTSQHLKDLTTMAAGGYLLKLRHVSFPLARKGLLIGFLIAFLFSIRELGSMLLILPPGKETIPIRIFSLIHYGAHAHVAVLALGMVILGFALSLVVLSLIGKERTVDRNQKSEIM